MQPKIWDGKRRTGRSKTETPSRIDTHVGSRVRLRRTLLGMSQQRLGEAIGLTFQQVQKYERGANRMGASRLFDIAKVLDVPIAYFFEDIPVDAESAPYEPISGDAEPNVETSDLDVATQREILDLVRAYSCIADPLIRRKLFDLAKVLADFQSVRKDCRKISIRSDGAALDIQKRSP